MSSIISVSNLTKKFKSPISREGIKGAVIDLFSKNFKEKNAVNNITFTVEEGEFLGFIGPNGAGKSTTIKMLTGILKPSAGSVSVLGFDPFLSRKEYSHQIGVVFGQRTQLWWDLPVIESLNLIAKIYRVEDSDYKSRRDNLIEILNLKNILHTPVRKLSLGERIRADLAASLLHNPKVLFLDEPTIGLDAIGKEEVRKFLRKINQTQKTTIILTTHDMNEIEELCKRLVIIDQGKILYDGEVNGVKHLIEGKTSVIFDLSKDITEEDKESINKFSDRNNNTDLKISFPSDKSVHCDFNPKKIPLYEIIRELVTELPVVQLKVEEPTIEEVIREIYKRGEV